MKHAKQVKAMHVLTPQGTLAPVGAHDAEPIPLKESKDHKLLNTIPMELKQATAGTMESGDIMIQIAPCEKEGLNIDLQSSVAYQFGDQIRKVIAETLEGLGITCAEVHATDKGALDCTIRARVTAAAVRATGKDVWKD